MILVHAIMRILVCLFIVGGIWSAGDIAQAQTRGQIADMIEKLLDFIGSEGSYIGVKGGISTAVDGTVDLPGLVYNTTSEPPIEDVSVNTKMSSPVYLVSLGGRNRWGRIEGEFSYRENKIKDFNFKQPVGQIQGEGGLENIAAMVNLLYEIKFESTELRPYLLGGLGASYVKYKEEKLGELLEEEGYDGFEFVNAQEKLMLAYQGGAGIRYPLFGTGINLDISYRWFGTPQVEFATMEGRGEETWLTFKNTHHTGTVGLVIDF